MKTQQLIRQYLDRSYMMQLATLSGDQPWCCTVYYVADDDGNLYWASLPTRRHSQEIKQHPKVAAAIPVKFAKGEKVAGIQVEGTAEEITDLTNYHGVIQKYSDKFQRPAGWIHDFANGQTEHKLYKLTPTRFVLFDDVNFPDEPRQEITL